MSDRLRYGVALGRLHTLRARAETADGDFCVTVSSTDPSPEEAAALAQAGVDRVIVSPWARSPDAVEALGRFAEGID